MERSPKNRTSRRKREAASYDPEYDRRGLRDAMVDALRDILATETSGRAA